MENGARPSHNNLRRANVFPDSTTMSTDYPQLSSGTRRIGGHVTRFIRTPLPPEGEEMAEGECRTLSLGLVVQREGDFLHVGTLLVMDGATYHWSPVLGWTEVSNDLL